MNAVHNIHTHLNLNGNEVRNVRLEGLPSDPDPVEGGVYFNLESGEFRFSDGTAWKSLLGGFWKLDDDGNLVTDRNVIIKKNITIGGDMSTDGEGEGTVTGVTSIIIDGVPYFAEDGTIDLSEAFEGLDVEVDLSDYYTKSETTGLVNTAIANLVNGAPETLDTLKEVADALAENADVVDALNAAIGNKADKATTLAGYGITDAYTRTEIDTKYSPVKTWYDELASLIVREGNNVRIKTNIIIDGDQSADGEGGSGTISSIIGIAVNGQTYTDTNNDGIIDLGTIGGGGIGEITSKMITDALGYTPLSTAGGTISSPNYAPLTIKREGSASAAISFENSVDGVVGQLGIGGSGYTLGKVPFFSDGGNTYAIIHSGNYAGTTDKRYLQLSGGTINGTTTSPLTINTTATDENGINFLTSGASKAWVGYSLSAGAYIYETSSGQYICVKNGTPYYGTTSSLKTLIHDGNIGSQSVAGIRIDKQIYTQEALDAFNDAQNLRFVGVGSILPSSIVASDGLVISIPWYNTSFGAQIAINDQSNVMLLRTRSQGVWNPWYQFITAKDDGYVYGLGGYIDIQYSDEINRYGGNLYLQHRGSNKTGAGTGGTRTGNIVMCANGGNVLIGTPTDSGEKLQIHTSTWDGGLAINRTISGGGASIAIYSNGTKIGRFGIDGSNWFEVSNTSDTRFWVDTATGKTTIGATSLQSSYMLYANGNSYISGNLVVAGDISA